MTEKRTLICDLSEASFRADVIIPVLKNMGYLYVREVHGADEQGTDILYCEKLLSGELRLIAMQVKRGPLSHGSNARTNLLSLGAQLLQSADTEQYIPEAKLRKKPDHLVVCASGKINTTTRNAFSNSKLETAVSYWDIETVIGHIDRYFPEYWQGLRPNIVPYCSNLIREVIERQDILHYSFGSEPESPVTNAYIEQKVSILNPHLRTTGHKVVRETFEFVSVEDIIGGKVPPWLHIEAQAGFGKTTLLKRIAWVASRNITDIVEPSALCTLQDISIFSNGRPAIEGLFMAGGTSVLRKDIDEYAAKGKLILLLDINDTLYTDDWLVSSLDNLAMFQAEVPGLRIVSVARPRMVITQVLRRNKVISGYLSNISRKQINEIVASHAAGDSSKEDALRECLRRLVSYYGLTLTPLLLASFLAQAETITTTHEVFPNLAEAIRRHVSLMLGQWDQHRRLSGSTDYKTRTKMLAELASIMQDRRALSLSEDELRSHVFDYCASRDILGPDEHLSQILGSGLLVRQNTQVHFSHQLIQEFLVGEFRAPEDFTKEMLADPWWQNPFVFSCAKGADSIELLLEHLSGEDSTVRNLEGITAIGLALQACYLSNISRRVELFKQLLGEASELTGRFAAKWAEDEAGLPEDLVEFIGIARMRDAMSSHAAVHLVSKGDFAELPETARAWCIASLIESGRYTDSFRKLVSQHITSGPCLFFIQMVALVVASVRTRGKLQKGNLDDLLESLSKSPEVKRIEDKFFNVLIKWHQDMKSGRLSIIDDLDHAD